MSLSKIAVLILIFLSLGGCTSDDDVRNSSARHTPKKICIGGVTYYEFKSHYRYAVTPAYKIDGTLTACSL